MLKRLFLLFVIATSTCTINAQVKTNFNNPEKIDAKGKFKKNYSEAIFQLAAPDLTKALAKEKAEVESGSKIFYIAEPVPVKIDVSKLASWVNDSRYSNGKFTLKSKGAKTLSINFSNFALPKGTEMYVYSKDAEMITGVITDAENNEAKVWGSSIYKGDEINIEVKLPVEEKEKLSLQITNVAYGYKNIFIEKVAGFGLSGACNINVLCPEGNNWVAERNSVVYIARSNGDALCSGAMLMNTCATNIPYVLTANHCFTGDGNVAGWRVHFQAWSPTCPNPGTNSDGILFNGSTLRANWAPSDFCLVQLNQTPAANSGIHYAGWSRETTAATSGVSIHHPSGDVMKISTYTTPLIREDDPARCFLNPVGELQWVVQWDQGVTEGGSSGSPLFDQNHRIVGQLSGGPSSCTQPANCRIDMYGRFDNSWTGGGTNATRLSNWLDPDNTGAFVTNTTNISSLANPALNLSITGNNAICSGTENYTLNGVPAGAAVSWVSSDPSIATVPSNGNPVTVTRTGNGIVRITATVTDNCYGNGVASKTIGASVPDYTKLFISNQAPCAGYPVEFAAHYDPWDCYSLLEAGITDIEWQIWSPYPYQVEQNYSTIGCYDLNNSGRTISFGNPYSTYEVQLRIRALNSCGWSDWSQIFPVTLIDCGGQWGFTASPNPATSSVEIALDEQTVKSHKTMTIGEIQITDKLGNIIKRFKYEAGHKRLVLDISGLKPDVYLIRVFNGKEWKSKSIIKQ